MNELKRPFWQTKRLDEMTPEEWESLCDGCGRCCLHKLENEETGDLFYTRVACRLLDAQSCRCRDYPNRLRHVPDCLRLTPDRVREFGWLPETCGYRLVAEGKPLRAWHPLVSGDPESVHRAGISVRGALLSDADIDMDRLDDYILDED